MPGQPDARAAGRRGRGSGRSFTPRSYPHTVDNDGTRAVVAAPLLILGLAGDAVNLQVGDRLPKRLGRCDNAWMTGLSIALANLKPGTGKTTSAVWLAHVFAQAGNRVLLVDADPSGSALEWSDLAAMDPRLSAPEAAFPFRVVALPSRELHRRVPEI